MEKTIEERDNLQSSVVLKDSKVKEQQKLLADLQENKRSFVEELKIKSKEIDQNKQRIKIIEEEKEALMRFNEKLLEENRIIDAYRHEVEEKTNEIKALQSTLEENQQEISSLNTGLHNLQTVHEETQVFLHKNFIDLCIFFIFLFEKFISLGKKANFSVNFSFVLAKKRTFSEKIR